MTLTEKLGAKALRALSHLPLWWLYRISDLLFRSFTMWCATGGKWCGKT